MSDFYSHDDDAIDDGPSKSQIKREDEAMQAVGARLVQLSRANINGLPVSDTLRDALHEFKRISSREAQRRHLKRVGKLLREHDVDAVTLALDKVSPDSALSMASTRAAERWCDRMLDDPRGELTAFIEQHPAVEVQRLRQLLRKAQKGADPDKPTPAQRELLKYVRQQVLAVK